MQILKQVHQIKYIKKNLLIIIDIIQSEIIRKYLTWKRFDREILVIWRGDYNKMILGMKNPKKEQLKNPATIKYKSLLKIR